MVNRLASLWPRCASLHAVRSDGYRRLHAQDPERKLLRTGGLFDGLPRRAMVTWIPPAMSSRSFELFLCTVRGIARIGNLPVPGPKLFPEGMTMKLENIRVGMVLRLKREV